MTKHTPGPWVRKGWMIYDAEGRVVHDGTEVRPPINDERDIANLKLIAASPSLLKALRGMVDAYEYEASANNPALLFAKEVLSEVDGE